MFRAKRGSQEFDFFFFKISKILIECCPVLLYLSPPPRASLHFVVFVQSWASPKDKKSCGMGMLRPSLWPPSTAAWALQSSSWTAWKRCVRRAITNHYSELCGFWLEFFVCFILRLVEAVLVLLCFFCRWRWLWFLLLLLLYRVVVVDIVARW